MRRSGFSLGTHPSSHKTLMPKPTAVDSTGGCEEGDAMSSFKLRLVLYFLLLSMLPLAAVFWGFSRVVAESETRLVDARLQAGVRAALAAYDERQREASRRALRLARDPRFARALARRD